MKYIKLGNTDIETSVIALGTWGLGGGSVWEDTDTDAANVSELLDTAQELGINYIDTASVYGMGRSEELLGKALQGRRDRFVLQTKCSLNWRENGGNFHYARDGYTVFNNTSADAVRKDVEDSLLRMHTDYIDSVVVHYVCSAWPVEETVASLEAMVREGKIRTYGLSNSQPRDLAEYCKYGNPSFVQEQYSILAPYHGNAYFEECTKNNVTFQPYGILEEGFLTGTDKLNPHFGANDIRTRLPWGKEPYRSNLLKLYEDVWTPLCEKYKCSYANLFEVWTLAQYENMSLLTGARRKQSLVDTVKCLEIVLDPQDVERMNDSVKFAQVRNLDK